MIIIILQWLRIGTYNETYDNRTPQLQLLYTGTRARDTRTFADCGASSHVVLRAAPA